MQRSQEHFSTKEVDLGRGCDRIRVRKKKSPSRNSIDTSALITGSFIWPTLHPQQKPQKRRGGKKTGKLQAMVNPRTSRGRDSSFSPPQLTAFATPDPPKRLATKPGDIMASREWRGIWEETALQCEQCVNTYTDKRNGREVNEPITTGSSGLWPCPGGSRPRPSAKTTHLRTSPPGLNQH